MTRARLYLPLLACALAFAGCGDSGPVSPAQLRIWSPAVQPNGTVSPDVTCGSGTLWLPMKWGEIPAGTEDLVIYFGRFADADPKRPGELKIPFGSAFPRVDLDARGTEANAFPPGAEPHYYRLTNCVIKPAGQRYFGAIFALDKAIAMPDPIDEAFARRITEEALGFESPSTKSKTAEELLDSTLAMGSFVATYGEAPGTKARFIEDAEAICAKSAGHYQDLFEKYVVESKSVANVDRGPGVPPGRPFQDYVEIVEQAYAPAVERELDELRALTPPIGDERRIAAILAATEEGLEKVEEHPGVVVNTEKQFSKANELAREYGFIYCA